MGLARGCGPALRRGLEGDGRGQVRWAADDRLPQLAGDDRQPPRDGHRAVAPEWSVLDVRESVPRVGIEPTTRGVTALRASSLRWPSSSAEAFDLLLLSIGRR